MSPKLLAKTMLENRVLEMVRLMGTKLKRRTNGNKWLMSECPFAPWTHKGGADRDPSFGITVGHGSSNYHCFSCGQKGKLLYLPNALNRFDANLAVVKELQDFILRNDLAEFDATQFPDYGSGTVFKLPVTKPWPEEFLSQFDPVIKHDAAIAYLATRQINARVIKDLDLRYDSFRRAVCFPFRDSDGVLAGMHGRHISPDAPYKYHAYKHDDTYNGHVWSGLDDIDVSKPLVIVESVFDLASVKRAYSNVICSRSASVTLDLMLTLPDCPYIITFYDNDKAGDSARKFIETNTSLSVIHIYPPDGKKDPGEMSLKEISSTLTTSII